MLLPAIALALVAQQAADNWSLKLSVEPKVKLAWNVTVDAQTQGQEHHASFTLNRTAKASEPNKQLVTFGWSNLIIESQEGQEIPPWDAIMGDRGEILKMEGDTDDGYRRMLAPFVFIYPDKPVAVGDKWKFEAKPKGQGAKATYSYEVKKADSLKDTAALLITSKFEEAGSDAMTGEGSWWINRAGRILKFELKLKNWIVPLAGADAIDATLKGEAR